MNELFASHADEGQGSYTNSHTMQGYSGYTQNLIADCIPDRKVDECETQHFIFRRAEVESRVEMRIITITMYNSCLKFDVMISAEARTDDCDLNIRRDQAVVIME